MQIIAIRNVLVDSTSSTPVFRVVAAASGFDAIAVLYEVVTDYDYVTRAN